MAPTSHPSPRPLSFTALAVGTPIRSRSTGLLYEVRRRVLNSGANSSLLPRLAIQSAAKRYRFWESAMLVEIGPAGSKHPQIGFYYSVRQIQEFFQGV